MKKELGKKITVLDYFDYFEYLKDQYEFLKQHKTGFSLRSFSMIAGIPSHSYFLRIIQRKRKLSEKYLSNFCKALHLDAAECAYFQTLVKFNNEKKSKNKEHYLKQLMLLRYKKKEEFRLEDTKLRFYQHWYFPVVRELAVLLDFQKDFKLLARKCIPKITAVQAKSAITYLVENKFLKVEANGRYSLVDYFISTGNEVNSTILRKYHKVNLHQSADVLDVISPDNRDVSSLTLRVSEKTYAIMKKEIQEFRKHLMDMARESDEPNMVCHVGLQLFPRSTGVGGEDIVSNSEDDD